MATQKQNDVTQCLKYMLSGEYPKEVYKFEDEIGLERYNLVVEYLNSINLLDIFPFESGKYRVNLKYSLDKNKINELIGKIERQEIII